MSVTDVSDINMSGFQIPTVYKWAFENHVRHSNLESLKFGIGMVHNF
jgi:hypothetical protein